MASGWSNLPLDLLDSVAKRLVSMEDVFCFAAVCKSWRSVATKQNFTSLLTHQVPLLLTLSDVESTSLVYNLTKGKFSKVYLPEATGERYYSSSYLGWVMTVSNEDMKVSLFNPFKEHSQIELPDINRTRWHAGRAQIFMKKFVLSSSPSWTSNYTVMVLGGQNVPATLEFCRAGDNQWTSIDTTSKVEDQEDTLLDDIAYYKGQFYVVGRYGAIFVCDIEDPQQPKLRAVVSNMSGYIRCRGYIVEQIYLVESAGDLLVVSRSSVDVFKLQVFMVPLSDGKWQHRPLELSDLGNRTLFIGNSCSSVSIDTVSNRFECKANCIYFTHLSIYDMEDRKFEPHLRKLPPKTLNHCLWILPSF